MNFHVYRSSAGSGKTFTLVLEYLVLVVKQPAAFRSVLAVTFTNKAANEMKQRVLKALLMISDNNIPDSGLKALLLEKLHNKTGLSHQQISRNCELIFGNIIHNYSDFNISTIDSFVNRLVRTFTRDLGLPSQFEVTMNDKYVIDRMVDRLVARVGHDSALTDTILLFLFNRIDEEKGFNIDDELAGFAKVLMKEDAHFMSRQISDLDDEDHKRIAKEVRQRIVDFEQRVVGYAREIVQLVTSTELHPFDLKGGKTGIGKVLLSLAEGDRIYELFAQKTLSNFLDNDSDYYPASATKTVKASIESIRAELDQAFDRIRQIRDGQFSDYALLKQVSRNLNSFSLSSKMLGAINEIIDETQYVHISEFNKRISTLLSNTAVPYIYERLGERYKHYLLDEFQDTSVLQWQNFLPLVANSLGEAKMSLLVGDAKQSIYRWRGGDVEQFLNLPRIENNISADWLEQAEWALKRNFQEFSLDQNFRSLPGIVDFNNDFFDYASQSLNNQIIEKVFERHRQKSVENDQSGLVRFDFIPKDAETDIWQTICESVLERVNQLMGRGFQAKDITIIVRRNKEGALLAGYLAANNIPVISADSLLLSASVKVRLLIHAMHCICDPDDRLQHVQLAVCLEQLSNQSWQPVESPAAYANMQLPDITAHFGFAPLEIVNGLSFYDQVEELVRVFRLESTFDPYVQYFLDHVYKFQISERLGMAAFLKNWPELSKNISVIIPGGLNAVQIMTIHKAKGLEFPVVIFPSVELNVDKARMGGRWLDVSTLNISGLHMAYIPFNKELLNTQHHEFYQRELDKAHLDLINLLYVVFTRAEKELHVFCPVPEKESQTAAQLYVSYLKARNIWQDNQIVFEIGTPFQVSGPVSLAEQAGQVQAMVSVDWTQRLSVAPVKSSGIVIESGIDALQFGRLFHEIVSGLQYSEDAQTHLEGLIYKGSITREIAERISGILTVLFDHPLLKPLFCKPALITNEASMCDENGRVFRADRFVRLQDQLFVVEYKTGQHEADHLFQLQNYMDLICRIEQKSVKGYLVYLTEELEVVEAEKIVG